MKLIPIAQLYFLYWILVFTTPAIGQALFNPAKVNRPGQSAISPGLHLAEVEYEIDGSDVDVERNILGASYSYGMAPNFDILGQFGYSWDAELDDPDNDGSGFMLGMGGKSKLLAEGKMRAFAHGLFNYINEKYENDDSGVEYEVDLFEIHLGGTMGFLVSRQFMPYGGLELVISDGELKAKLGSAENEEDMERDSLINLRLGANFLLGSTIISGEATLLGEKTFHLSAMFLM